MEINKVLELFDNACRKREWGEYSYLVFYSDGSGDVNDDDGDKLFSFNDVDELINQLGK